MKIFGCYLCRSHQIILEDCRAAFSTGENCGSSIWRAELSAAPVAARITHISMTFDHHAVLQLAAPLPAGERSDRACAIRVRGAGSMTVCDPLTRDCLKNATARCARATLQPFLLLLSRSFAISVTCSGSNWNLRNSSLRGADAPNVFMPMMRPDFLPT